MRRLQQKLWQGPLAGLGVLLALVAACSTDSPTAPTQEPPPGPPPPDASWRITVRVEPGELLIGSDQPATVTARFESRDTGDAPPNGATMVFSTSIGEFGTAGSDVRSAAGVITRGRASILLFPGDIQGLGVVTAQLERSTGQGDFEVLPQGARDPFISGIAPNTGPAGGGTLVTIDGQNFREPLRVFFGNKLGGLGSVSTTSIRVTTPPGDIETADCDEDSDGISGIKQFDTPVDVIVELAGGTRSSVPSGFTYTVGQPGVCVGD